MTRIEILTKARLMVASMLGRTLSSLRRGNTFSVSEKLEKAMAINDHPLAKNWNLHLT